MTSNSLPTNVSFTTTCFSALLPIPYFTERYLTIFVSFHNIQLDKLRLSFFAASTSLALSSLVTRKIILSSFDIVQQRYTQIFEQSKNYFYGKTLKVVRTMCCIFEKCVVSLPT